MEQEFCFPFPLLLTQPGMGRKVCLFPLQGKKAHSRTALRATEKEAIIVNIIHARKNSQLPSYRTTLCPVSQ